MRQIVSGEKGTAQVCCEHSLVESVLAWWCKEYELRREAAFAPRQDGEVILEQKVAELERFCGQLALENHTLKKLLQTAPSRSDTP